MNTFRFGAAAPQVLAPAAVPVIGLWSPAPQSGKSTVAGYLAQLLPLNYRLAFADPLRAMLRVFLGAYGVRYDAVERYLNNPEWKERVIPEVGKTFVELAIALGTKFGRGEVGSECWVKPWEAQVRTHLEKLPGAVVLTDDMRFRNELLAVRRAGGITVGIVRPGTTVSQARAAAEGHLSLADMDYVIHNDGCLLTLQCQVDRLAKGLRL